MTLPAALPDLPRPEPKGIDEKLHLEDSSADPSTARG